MDDYADIFRSGFDEYREFINPLIAQRAALAGEPVRLVRARAGRLVDPRGHEIEDFHGTQAFGHRNGAIMAALQAFFASDAPSWYPSRVNPFAGRLARRICERTGFDNVFLACTGSDAVEAALKLARALTRKPRILGLEGGYHGCSYGSVSIMSPGYLRDAFTPLLEGAETIPFGDVDALARALAPGDVCAVVVEPIQGEGGVRELPAPFVEALCDLTRKYGALLVADEVQTALGRSGRGFLATTRWPRQPDCVLLAKHLGGGLVPVSAMLTRRELFLDAYGKHFASGESHNTTMGFNAVTCVAALATLDLLTDATISRVHNLGAQLLARIHQLLQGSPLYREVRGTGFMMGVALRQPDHPWLSFEHFGYPDLGQQSIVAPLTCHRLYRRGFFCFSCGHDWSILRLQPRFDIPAETLETFAVTLAEELAHIATLT